MEEVDDGASPFDQARQQLVGDGDEAADVGVDHLLPLREVAALGRPGAERQTGVVHQQIDPGEGLGQGGERRVHRGVIAHVEGGDMGDLWASELLGQRREALGAAGGDHHLPATGDEAAGGGGTETGGGAGDECDGGHGKLRADEGRRVRERR